MTGKKTLQKLNQTYTQKELSNIFNVSIRTIQRWKKDGFPKKSPLQKEIQKIEATGEIIKYKRKPESIKKEVEKIKSEQIATRKNKAKSKNYLIIYVTESFSVLELKTKQTALIGLRNTIKNKWKKFYQKYRYLYLYGEIYAIGDIDNETEASEYEELIAKVITETDESDRIEKLLSRFIEKLFELYTRYDRETKLSDIALHFLNILK